MSHERKIGNNINWNIIDHPSTAYNTECGRAIYLDQALFQELVNLRLHDETNVDEWIIPVHGTVGEVFESIWRALKPALEELNNLHFQYLYPTGVKNEWCVSLGPRKPHVNTCTNCAAVD